MENINPCNLIAVEIFGIDPGKGGAIAKFKQGSKTEIVNMPEFNGLCDYFDYQLTICKNPLIAIEKVQGRNGDEKSGKRFGIEKMLYQYAELMTVIKTRKIQYIDVHPMSWQRYLNIWIKGEDYVIRKRRFCDIAKEMYPGLKVTLKNCDALLITEFARRKIIYDKFWIIQNLKKPIKERDLFK